MKKIPRGLAAALSAALILGLVPALSASATDPVPPVATDSRSLPFATDALSLPAAAVDPEQRAAAPMDIEDVTRAADRKYALPLNPDTYRLTSPQGPRCIPVIGGSTHHLGQDLGTNNGAPIYAVTDGVVRYTKNGTSSASGQIILKHDIDGQAFETAYLHMWNATTHVKVGQKVKAGQKIGLVGSSGPSTGPHLHLEVWKERFYSQDSNVVVPAAWLNSRGISLAKYATEIYPQTPPASCTYYARGKIDIFATDSSSSKVLARVPRNAAVTSKPGSINGMINGDFVKITYGKVTGWANRYAVTPNRLADAAEGSLTSSGVATNGMLLPFGKYRLTGTANFRTGPSTWYSSMGQVSQGTSVEALESRDGWLRVSRQGMTGWISATLLARTAVLDPTKAKATHQTAYATKLRRGVGDGHPEIRELAKATKAAIRRIQGSWTQLQIGTETGWVSSASIHRIGTAAPKPPAPAPKATHTTTNNLNLREGPATSTKILRELPKGTKVTVLSAQGTWRRIQVDSDKGWVAAAYLKAIQVAPKPPVAQPKPPVAQPKPPVAQPKPPVAKPKPPVAKPKHWLRPTPPPSH